METYGLELIEGRWFQNLIRLVLHTKCIKYVEVDARDLEQGFPPGYSKIRDRRFAEDNVRCGPE